MEKSNLRGKKTILLLDGLVVLKANLTSLTITKESTGRYFISIIVKEAVESLPFVKKEIGIDLGLKELINDHEGNSVHNPKFLKKEQQRLKRNQKSLSRKKKGSNNREKARIKVACSHAKIRDKRNDHHHKLSRQLVNENQVIVVENLQVKNMIKNRHLSHTIADTSWGLLLKYLEYKCQWHGRDFVKVGTFFPSSKRCSTCGHTLKELKLSIRYWECPECHTFHNRDTNAAKNILEEGLCLLGKSTLKSTVGHTGI